MSPEAHPAYEAPDPLLCRIYTGTYIGDGTLGLAIVGVGFRPKFVWIGILAISETDDTHVVAVDTMTIGNSALHSSVALVVRDNRITTLDADGFTVSDDNIDADPNKLDRPYWFICLG